MAWAMGRGSTANCLLDKLGKLRFSQKVQVTVAVESCKSEAIVFSASQLTSAAYDFWFTDLRLFKD